MKVSVCMATYNGEKYIKEQLHSILIQLSDSDEIIISDDSSIDNTVKIIKSFNDDRIKLYENNTFKNPIYNFENAIKKSSGELIILSDQDDIWNNNKVEVIKKKIENYVCLNHNAELINQFSEDLGKNLFDLNKSKKGIVRNIIKNSYVGCCMAFRREVLKKALPFPNNIPMHDSWIGLISEIYGEVIFLNESLIKYRRHESNLSSTGLKSEKKITLKIRERIILMYNLITRGRINKNDNSIDSNIP